jgi:hypothetical protein
MIIGIRQNLLGFNALRLYQIVMEIIYFGDVGGAAIWKMEILLANQQ